MKEVEWKLESRVSGPARPSCGEGQTEQRQRTLIPRAFSTVPKRRDSSLACSWPWYRTGVGWMAGSQNGCVRGVASRRRRMADDEGADKD